MIIETNEVDLVYGFTGTEMIVDHPTMGRLLIVDGYGGEGSIRGGAVRWEHGMVIQLIDGDTLASLELGSWNECTTLKQAVLMGLDDARPVLELGGHAVAAVVAKAAA